MKWILGMAAGCLATWLVAMAVSPALGAEVFLGMLGPFLAVSGTWVMVERTARTNPGGMTSAMLTAFAVKMGFFALYVIAVIGVPGVDRTPFVLSFTAYFIALYAVEALMLRRLFERLA